MLGMSARTLTCGYWLVSCSRVRMPPFRTMNELSIEQQGNIRRWESHVVAFIHAAWETV